MKIYSGCSSTELIYVNIVKSSSLIIKLPYTERYGHGGPKFLPNKRWTLEANWIDVMVQINGPVSPVPAFMRGIGKLGAELPLLLPNCPLVEIDDNDTHSVQVIASGPAFPDDLIAQSLATVILCCKRKYYDHFTFTLCQVTILLKHYALPHSEVLISRSFYLRTMIP